MSKPLLPAGCYDTLPPYARQEAQLSATLLSVFENYGYEQVAPPLLEYSESLLAGRGAALSPQIFRLMDPDANKVMGIRPDITLQIARIAANRLAETPRPLRLCYNGLILRMSGHTQHAARQLRQTGIELIGPTSPEADAEVIMVAAQALMRAGVAALTIDLNLPGMVSSLLADAKFSEEELTALLSAISHKDTATIARLSFAYRDALLGLMRCAGPADAALTAMNKLNLPTSAKRQLQELEVVARLLKSAGYPAWTITIDPTESREMDYHSGLSFSIFVPGASQEVGRGGRYRAHSEDATGFTLYVETLRELLPSPKRGKRILISEDVPAQQISQLQAQGYVTVYALPDYGFSKEEARRLGCEFILVDQNVHDING